MTKKEILENYGSQIKELGIQLGCVTKKELLSIINFRCMHGHSAFTHPNCYRTAPNNLVEKVGILDIESSQLKANFGMMLSWAIKTVSGDVYYDSLKPEDLNNGLKDSRIIKSIIKRMKKYDRVVGQYSSRFDIPFIRTRAEYWDIDFPKYGEIYHTDVWRISRRKLCLHSNRQGSIAQTLLGENIKTRINPDIWLNLQFGSEQDKKSSMDYIVDHNIKDVIQLEKIYLKLRDYIKESRTSI